MDKKLDYKELVRLRNFYIDNKYKINKDTLRMINEDFELRFHHHSTKIEGNTLTLFEVKTILEDNISIGGKNLREIYEVVNNKNAFNYIKKLITTNQKIDKNIIKDIHEIVTNNIFQGGIYRSINVRISGALFIPPSWEEVRSLMKFFISDLRSMEEKLQDVDEIMLASWIHAEFVRIHPFIDGNGRTARLLLNYSLMEDSFLPINIESSYKSIYYEALDKYGKNPSLENPADFKNLIMIKEYQQLKEMEQEILSIK